MSFQEIYEYILKTNLINFLIMISTLVFIFKKFKLGTMIDTLSIKVKENVDLSAQTVKSAFDEYKKIKKESKETDSKKAEIINEAQNIAKKLEEKAHFDIKQKEETLDLSAKKTKEIYFEQKLQKTSLDIQKAVLELSVDSIQNMMNTDIQNKLITKALDEFDKIGEVS